MNKQPFSIYIHIPFCLHRCAYCDFNTYAGLEEMIPAYVEALCNEIRWVSETLEDKIEVHTIFLGGGTPSLLTVHQIQKIVDTLDICFSFRNPMEISLEANPGTVSQVYMRDLSLAGINRLSIGMQSAKSQDLTILERQHSLDDVVHAVEWAQKAGIENINLDLIFGIPYQSLLSWKSTLSFAVRLKPKHLSVYSLTIEQDTMMAGWVKRGLIATADPDLAADMYEHTCELLEANCFKHYEISNWAKRDVDGDWACRHNLQYWRSDPYLGFGAGAHGLVGKIHTIGTLNPSGYIHRMQDGLDLREFPRSPATISASIRSFDEESGDFMIMGLRLLQEGVSRKKFRTRFGIDLENRYGDRLGKLLQQDLIVWDGDNLRLTQKGYLLGNLVFREFV